MKKVLTIAGSDCSGGAGVQADLKTFSAHGVYGMSVIAAIVAENTCRVLAVQEAAPEMIRKQMDAVFEDIEVDAVKVGMLSSPACMRAVAEGLKAYRPRHVVVDPVMYAKNGSPLMAPSAIGCLIREVLPLSEVLTPNIPEAEEITGMTIERVSDMERAARRIRSMGCGAVVVKGGHACGEAVDVLYDGSEFYHFTGRRIATKNTHGTGCTFSSAIAARLAEGCGAVRAVGLAKEYVQGAIENALSIGRGNGPTHHFYALYRAGLSKEAQHED